jgi:hypothetical protein
MPLFFLIPIAAGALVIGLDAGHALDSASSMMGSAESDTVLTTQEMSRSPMQEHQEKSYPPCAKNTDKRGPHDDCVQKDRRK